MSLLVSGSGETEWKKLTDGSATTIFSANNHTGIVFIMAQENAGSSQDLSIYREDKNGTKFYFINARTFSAKERVTFEELFFLKGGDTIKALSSSSSGLFDLYVTYLTR